MAEMAWSKAPSSRAKEFAGETMASKVVCGGRLLRRALIRVMFGFGWARDSDPGLGSGVEGLWGWVLLTRAGQWVWRALEKAVMKDGSWQRRRKCGILEVILRFAFCVWCFGLVLGNGGYFGLRLELCRIQG